MTSVLEPLVPSSATSRRRIEALARENGKFTADLERAAGTVVALGDELERLKQPERHTEGRTGPAPAAPSTDAPFASTGRWWLRWALALVGAILLAGVLLMWPR